MQGSRAKCRTTALAVVALWVALFGLHGLLKPYRNGCSMTYMYPTYIPISVAPGASRSGRYALYLYHEGWKKIDFAEHLKTLSGVPVLFVPGNGGSYKQVRSFAAESDRAYQAGPQEHTFYQEASLTPEEGGVDIDTSVFKLPNQYTSRLDWFTVDLEGEHSAMDGQILEEHTEYVVFAIHRILDQYKESRDARAREGAASSGSLPKSVILVGHSIGGFVARAAVVHPQLRKSAVETILTLSSPHQAPPLALQPSLGHYFAHVNQAWRKGYEVQTSRAGHVISDPLLSRVVIISISGGYFDYQIRTKLGSLDGIVPPTHGFMISSTSIKNVWLSMDHQGILWCNQLVVQVSHTLLSLVDSRTSEPFSDSWKRLATFARMLRSGVPHNFSGRIPENLPQRLTHLPNKDVKEVAGSVLRTSSPCPSNAYWHDDGLEKDLYIQTSTVTVLAMDGRRRWLDIKKQESNGKRHFILVTNLAPCSGVRLHLWPEKGNSTSDLPASEQVLEVTSNIVRIPSGPAPRQIEPGGQTEQAPPSAVFRMGPEDMHGFRFLTISVAPRPTISGRPPPATSMAVGQFFNPEEGMIKFSPQLILLSAYSQKDVFMKEDHPLAFDLSFAISLGLLPVKLSLKTVGCGIKSSGVSAEEVANVENSRLCKLRCFPPVALAWDATSGLHIFPNLYSETIVVDSSPAVWSSTSGSEKTTVMLLADPHCSYKSSISVPVTAAASRFLILYGPQIVGFSVAVVFFALMRQADAWDHDMPIPSMLIAVESNLRMPSPFILLAIIPILVSLLLSLLMSQPFPPIASFTTVSIICYLLANGVVILLVSVSQLVFYVAASLLVFMKTRWEVWEQTFSFVSLQWLFSLSSSFFSLRVIRIVRSNQSLVTALAAITLVCFVHPALGLFVIPLSHAFRCHSALCSFLTASLRSHAQRKEVSDSKDGSRDNSQRAVLKSEDRFHHKVTLENNLLSSPNCSKSFVETQLEIFHHCHGLLILHLIAALMFVPSLLAWLQRLRMGHSFPWFLDSILCIGVILHGVCNSKPEFHSFLFPFPSILPQKVRLYYIYLLAGYFSSFSGLAFTPYRLFYAMASVGAISFSLRILERRMREKGETHSGSRKRSHKHS